MSDELKASRLKADYAEKMLHTANRQLDELTRAHAEVLDTLDDLLDKYSVHNRASVGAQLVSVQHILTDLIAELRDAHHPMADLDGEPSLCIQGCGILPCHSLSAAASAEARLRAVTGDE